MSNAEKIKDLRFALQNLINVLTVGPTKYAHQGQVEAHELDTHMAIKHGRSVLERTSS